MPTNLLVLLSTKNIILFIVIFTRLGGLLTSCPVFSTYPIPNQVKIWLIATIAFIMYPLVMAKSGFVAPTSMPVLTVILIKEFMIGFVIGFISNMVFVGVEIAADLISMQMGLSADQAFNPLSGGTSSVYSQFYMLLATMVFIGLNAHQWLFASVYQSFGAIPPGFDFVVNTSIFKDVMLVCGQMYTIAVGIALPLFAVLFMTDVLFGFVAKMMPQLNIFMVALPLKIYIGLLLTVMFMQHFYSYIAVLIEKTLVTITSMF